jgi:hypothetical protein
MIYSCFMPHNSALNKLFSLDQPNISNAWASFPYEELCDHLWSSCPLPPICTLLCNGVGCGCCFGFYSTQCLTLGQFESAWCVCLPCEGIYITYIIVHGIHALANRLVLLVSACIPIFERSAPNPQLFLWHEMCFVHLHPWEINFHQGDISHAKIDSYCILWHLTMFLVGMHAIFKVIIWWSNVLVVPFSSCMI